MTEAEWNACTDPEPMLVWLWSKRKDRQRIRGKSHLLLCAYARCIQELIRDERSRKAVSIAERLSASASIRERLDVMDNDAMLHGNDFHLPRTGLGH